MEKTIADKLEECLGMMDNIVKVPVAKQRIRGIILPELKEMSKETERLRKEVHDLEIMLAIHENG